MIAKQSKTKQKEIRKKRKKRKKTFYTVYLPKIQESKIHIHNKTKDLGGALLYSFYA